MTKQCHAADVTFNKKNLVPFFIVIICRNDVYLFTKLITEMLLKFFQEKEMFMGTPLCVSNKKTFVREPCIQTY